LQKVSIAAREIYFWTVLKKHSTDFTGITFSMTGALAWIDIKAAIHFWYVKRSEGFKRQVEGRFGMKTLSASS
jgi:hypothetical protein